MSMIIEKLQTYFKSMTDTVEPLAWRRRARAAAYLELALCFLAFVFSLAVLVHGATVGPHDDESVTNELDIKNVTQNATISNTTLDNELVLDEQRRDHMRNLVFGTVFLGAISGFDIWSAILLYKATKPGGEPKLAMERAKNWRYVQVVLTLSAAIVTGFTHVYSILSAKLFTRLVLITIVSKYMVELKNNIEAAKPSGNDLRVIAATT